MFRDSIPICPFNIITGADFGGGTGGTDGLPTLPGLTSKHGDGEDENGILAFGGVGGPPDLPGALRGFRDNILLQSALGAAMVDAYYTVAPQISAWMLRSSTNMTIAKTVYQGMTFCLMWRLHLLLPLLALVWLARRALRRRPLLQTAGLTLLAGAVLTSTAWAQVIPATTAQLTEQAEQVLLVEVVAMESYEIQRPGGKRIQTDVSVQVLENAKGGAAKQSVLTFTLPTGQVGDFITRSSVLADFEVGERAVVFLVSSQGLGWHVLGGFQGKVPVFSDAKTGETYMRPMHHVQANALKIVAKEVAQSKEARGETTRAKDGVVTVGEFLDYVRAQAWEDQ
jgi:hypothetical protein